MRRRLTGSITTDFYTEGARNQELEDRLNTRVDDAISVAGASSGSPPEVDSTFTPVFSDPLDDIRGVYVTLGYFLGSSEAEELKIAIVQRDRIATSDDLQRKRYKRTISVESTHRNASPPYIAARFDKLLKFGKVHDVIRLVRRDLNGSSVANPDSATFTGSGTPPYPVLFSFTTPSRFNPPSAPAANLVILNRLNPATPEFDADLTVRIHSPLTLAGAAQTWAATNINNEVEAIFDILDAPKLITNATNANPIVITTSAAHGYTTGNTVVISGVGGNTAANGRRTITVTGGTTFSIAVAGNGAYTSGGLAEKLIDKTRLSHVVKSDDTLVDATSTPANRGYVDLPKLGISPARHWQWRRNVLHILDDVADVTTDPPIDIFTGNVKPAANGIPEITSTSFTATNSEDGDGKQIHLDFNFTQPTPAVGLKKYVLIRSLLSDYSVTRKVKKHTLRLDEYVQSGAQVLDLGLAKAKPGVFNYYRLTLIATSEAQRVFDFSNTASARVLTDADGNIAQDTTAPVIANPPNFKYSNGAFVCKLKHADVTQVASLSKVELSINNGTDSLNLDDLESDTVASGIVFYDIGNAFKMTAAVSRDRVYRTLGRTGTVKCAFRLTNSISVTTSSDSATLSLATLKDKSKRTNHQQRLLNPAFTYDDGAGNVDDWNEFNPNNGSFNLIQTSSGRIRWDDVNARVWWRENTSGSGRRYLAQSLGITFIPGDKWACSFIVESDGSLTINFDFFLACTPTISGTANPDGTTTLLGTGTAFLTEIKVGDEVTVNSETRTVQSITDDTHLVVTSAFSNTAGGATIYCVSPQSEIIQMGNQNLTAGAERQVEGVFTISANANTSLATALFFRPNGTISTASPYLYFARPVLNIGETPAEFTYNPTQRADFDVVVTGGGGIGQEGSGESPSSGGFEILQA